MHRRFSPTGPKSREDNEEQTQLSLVYMCMKACAVCVFLLTQGTVSIPEGGSDRKG